MLLKYHQATYDLLTQTPISPQKSIENYELMENSYHNTSSGDSVDEALLEKKAHSRKLVLEWTKLKLYQRRIQISPTNVDALDELERRYQIKLPDSVREWYSLDINPQMMTVSGWADVALKGPQPASTLDAYDQGLKTNPNLWVFGFDEYIEQGGEYLVFEIGGSDDPPVFAVFDTRLIQVAETFSKFLLIHFWRWHTHYTFPHHIFLWHHPQRFGKQVHPKYHIPLEQLSQQFTRISTQWFYDDDVRLHVFQRETLEDDETNIDNEAVMTSVRIFARSIPALRRCLKQLWKDNIPVLNFVPSWDDKAGEALLKELTHTQFEQIFENFDDWLTIEGLLRQLGQDQPLLTGVLSHLIEQMIEQGEISPHPDNSDLVTLSSRFKSTKP